MPQTIQVRAREPLAYQGQAYAPGDLFRAAIPDALALRHRRRVDFAPYARPEPTPPARTIEPPTQTVETREETTSSTEPSDFDATDEGDESKPSRRRSYRRRDLKAEP